jgi:hypothetical protein
MCMRRLTLTLNECLGQPSRLILADDQFFFRYKSAFHQALSLPSSKNCNRQSGVYPHQNLMMALLGLQHSWHIQDR